MQHYTQLAATAGDIAANGRHDPFTPEPLSHDNPVWRIAGRLETAGCRPWFSELRGCWLAQCPLCAEHDLCLWRGKDGQAQLECLERCDCDEVYRALRLGVFDFAERYVRRPAAEACDDSSLEETVAPRSECRRAA